MKSVAAELDAIGIARGIDVLRQTERIEQTRTKIGDEILSGCLAQNGGEQEGGPGIVDKGRTRLVRKLVFQNVLNPRA